MVNKGQIRRELRYSQTISSSSIKTNEELRWEIRDFSNFGKKTLRKIHEIKNHLFWITIHEEIKEQNQNRKATAKREKTKKLSKIQLIYYSKLKSNDTRQKIRRKTHNLTWYDPIDCWTKGFSFHEFESEFHNSIDEISLFFWQNLDFKHSLDAKMSLEEKEIKRFKDWDI